MERLTKRIFVPKEERELVVFTKGKYIDTIPAEMTHEDIRKVLRKLAEYEDFEEIFREKMTGTACEFLKDKEEFSKWLDRNKWIAKKCDEWVRAEEQGLLLRLPCHIGDSIYSVVEDGLTIIELKFSLDFYVRRKNDFGKTVFLTKAEAEQKLKEMESDDMTRTERDELHKAMNEITVEPTEPMNLEQIQAFVKGYELAYLNILDSIDKCYRNMKTD